MSLTAPIDIYCERLGPGLLAEPLNLFSNLSFLIAAILATRVYLKQRATPQRLFVVLGLYAIAIGSATFHSFATGWAQLADIIPIGLAMLYFLGTILRGPLGMNVLGVALGFVALAIVTVLFALLPADWFNQSNQYFGGLLTLFVLGLFVRRREPAYGKTLLLCAGVFAFSLTLRSIDMLLCPYWPYGTHFAWHLLNGAMVYLLAKKGLTYS